MNGPVSREEFENLQEATRLLAKGMKELLMANRIMLEEIERLKARLGE